MDQRIILLPQPRRLVRREGTLAVSGDLLAQARRTTAAPGGHSQGYHLSIAPEGVTIAASDPAGFFYAEQTLRQLLRQFPSALPYVEIDDHPDFPARGVMLDISRDKVPTISTLFALVEMLAEWKINQLQLYTEHTFAYREHRQVWADASPMTADEIRALAAFCRQRFIELVPNQNSFGHMERWLTRPPYRHLAEAPDGADTPWGFRWHGPFSLCPTDPASIDFLRGLYAELLPNFSSRLFNVGCDETFDIGQGRSKAECDRRGVTRVYLDFLGKVNELVQSHGRSMMFWGDIIVKKPELIAELPPGVIAMEWGYEADHPFDRDGESFASAGVPFYVCPGTSSWNSIAGRTDNAIANLRSAAEHGLKHGAIGYLITDWGDNGHLQYLPVSYLGFAAGAAFSWCLESNRDIDLIAALNAHAFVDPTAVLGRVACDLGNVYRVCPKNNVNGSALFRVLVPPPNDANPKRHLTAADLEAVSAAIDRAIAPLSDAGLIPDEFRNAAAMLRHAIALAGGASGGVKAAPGAIIGEHRRLWLLRNRPGGLADSAARLAPCPGVLR
ncbi:MAG TPA: family 20 glycosylhydrolase [Tepidisphaeraceae bacterium]|nr:family 20 glycosylhydrolase [Tepidisphaeraceae bacterium]